MSLPSRGEIPTRARQVVIVGAGVGGLCAAIALRRSGLDVVVLEQATKLREVGAGVVLWPNAMRVLQRLEVGAAIEDAGVAAATAALRSSRGTSLGAGPVDKVAANIDAPTVVVHRGLLQMILLAALDQHVLRLGAKCVGVGQDAQGVTVSLADGSTEHGDLVVGADGLHSRVRTALMGDGPPRYSGYTAWRGIVPLDRSLADRLRPGESWGRGRLFGVAMLGGSQAYWWASARTGERAGGSPAEEKAAVERRFEIWHEPIPELIDATLEQAIVRTCQYDRPPLRRWSAGRVGLLGDAAHPMLASLGQGACQAIEDAVVLAQHLAGAADPVAALRSYETSRFERTSSFVRRARLIGSMGRWRNPIACAVRSEIASLAIPGPALRRHRRDMAYAF